jgi:hypothetical protein
LKNTSRNVKSINKIQWFLCQVFTVFTTLLCDKCFQKLQWYLCHVFITLLCDRFFRIIQWYLCHVFTTLFRHRKSVIKCDIITHISVINMCTFFVIKIYAVGVVIKHRWYKGFIFYKHIWTFSYSTWPPIFRKRSVSYCCCWCQSVDAHTTNIIWERREAFICHLFMRTRGAVFLPKI